MLSKISFALNCGEQLGLVGLNGCGKATLLRILARVESSDAGSVHFNPAGSRVGYLPQGLLPEPENTLESFLFLSDSSADVLTEEVSRLAEALVRLPGEAALQAAYEGVLSRLEASAANDSRLSQVLGALGLGDYMLDTPVAHLSGGQKTRLSLACLVAQGCTFLLLDEPLNHLDIPCRSRFEQALGMFEGTALAVVHDRYFIEGFATELWEVQGKKLTHHYL